MYAIRSYYVQDSERVDALLANCRIDTIYHAAAYKHVPLVEENVLPGVVNNVLGTQVVAAAAAEDVGHRVPQDVVEHVVGLFAGIEVV